MAITSATPCGRPCWPRPARRGCERSDQPARAHQRRWSTGSCRARRGRRGGRRSASTARLRPLHLRRLPGRGHQPRRPGGGDRRRRTCRCCDGLPPIARAGTARRRAPLEVSIKLSALGQSLPDGEEIAAGQRPDDLRGGRATPAPGSTSTPRTTPPPTRRCRIVARAARRSSPSVGDGAAGLPAPHRGRLPRPVRRRARGSGSARAPTRSPRRSPSRARTRSTRPTCAACGS